MTSLLLLVVVAAAAGPGEKNLNDAHRNVHSLWQKVLEFIVLNAFSSFTNAFSLIVEKCSL